MKMAEMTDEQRAGLKTLVAAGYLEGDQVQVLVDIPGFSLTRAWLKRDYPLLLHSHDCDCLYYVLAGSLQMGSEELVEGDSFFVPADAAYQYRPGPEGVEVLEFRHVGTFDFRNLTKNPSFYEKAAATVAANVQHWREAAPPSAKRAR
jgi:mannose-6-phosphate isomerase-like protein (cupin superfamily)